MNRKKYTNNQEKAYEKTSGYRLLKAMENKKLTNIKLAENVGCSDQTISNFITNKNDILNSKYPLIEKICIELGIDIDYLQGKITHSTKELEIVCSYTGLSESVVKRLNETKDYPDFLSHALESYPHDFELLISEIKECLINSTIEHYSKRLPPSHPLSVLGSEDQKDSSIHLINCLRAIERLSISAPHDDWILDKIKESPTLKLILPESDNT